MTIKYYYTFLTLFALLLVGKAIGQTEANRYRFHNIKIKDEEKFTSINNIYKVVQDTLGFIWGATEAEGLMRYDGKTFHRPKWNDDLWGDWLSSDIAVDGNGNFWISFNGNGDYGVIRINPYTDKLDIVDAFLPPRSTFHEKDGLDGRNIVLGVKSDEIGNIWMGSYNNLFFYDVIADSIRLAFYDSTSLIQPIGNADENYFVFSSYFKNNTYKKIDKNTLTVTNVHVDKSEREWRFNLYPGLGKANYLIESNSKFGILKRYLSTGHVDTIYSWNEDNSLSYKDIGHIYAMPDGDMWVTSRNNNGIHVLSSQKPPFIIKHHPENKFSLLSDVVNDILVDHSGNYWLATEKGLSVLNAQQNPITHLNIIEGKDIDENQSGFSHIAELNDQTLLLSMGSGFKLFDREKGILSTSFDQYPSLKRLNQYVFLEIFLDHENMLWLHRYEPIKRNHEFYRYNHVTDHLEQLDFMQILFPKTYWENYRSGYAFTDEQNRMYFISKAPEENFYQLNSSNDSFINVYFDKKPTDPRKYHFDKTNHQLLVIGSEEEFNGELYIYTRTNNAGLEFTLKEKRSLNCGRSWELSFYPGQDNTIWLSSHNGVYKLDAENYSPDLFVGTDELPGRNIHGILEDDWGSLWLSFYEKGLARINRTTKQVTSFTTMDGLASNRFWIGAAFKDQNGSFYLGDDEGLTIFHPDSINNNTTIPPVYITNLKLFHKDIIPDSTNSILQNPIPITSSLELNHNQNMLTFEYVALNYLNAEKNEYAYQLIGFDEDWQYVGNKREATYTNLPPGQYTFRVKGSNNNGVWNEQGAALQITILPPWYQTWWARTLFALLLLGILYAIYRWRTQAQREKIIRQQKALEKEQEVNQRLQRIDQLKDQFLANTSHELRTPLHGIIGLSEAIHDRSADAKDREDLNMIIASGKRLNNLVNDILDFSKLKNFDIQLSQKPIGLFALVDVVLKNNAPMVKGKALELVNTIDRDLPAVWADENRLQQILYNLIGNAIKFTESGKVEVNARQEGDMIRIAVKDTGIGIPEEKIDAIFQEFEQADASISRQFAGTGLGLSISKRMAELHGGRMWVASKPGEGATFFFTLPVSEEKASTIIDPSTTDQSLHSTVHKGEPDSGTIAMPDHAIASNGTEGIRILVVDDEPINQQVLKNHLAQKGFRITQAMNGEEAIKAIETQDTFDLVLLDVMMPRMSGYEVCQKIRKKYLQSELPVIMVTAKDQLQDVVQGLSLGANDYLPKPFHKEELLARIKTQLDLQRIFTVAGKFVPNAFLHSLNRERITDVELGDHVEQEVTVLFADIRDYTNLAEKMAPEENFKFVNAFNKRMGPQIQKHGGFVNQYLGDAIMAIFPNSPESALQAAIDMQAELRAYNEQRIAKGRQPIKMGIGFHTGSLIMGIIGDQKRMDATTIADTVNTASRIESLTKHYGATILVSEDSMAQMSRKDSYNFRYLGKVLVKGKDEPVGLYECIDGDATNLRAQKLKGLIDFEEGLQHFYKRQFYDAVTAFNKSLQACSEDRPARLFLSKASAFTIDGVSKDWTGIEVMRFK